MIHFLILKLILLKHHNVIIYSYLYQKQNFFKDSSMLCTKAQRGFVVYPRGFGVCDFNHVNAATRGDIKIRTI
jgi:hypothetical protein